MTRPSLEDYVDVAERITAFKERYPDGSLQTLHWEVMDVAGKTFIVYRAVAYRTPDDMRPGHGTAWEPFPGPTPYTRDSELMNAETSAWGRAIVAVGITASRKLASVEEVMARGGGGDRTESNAAPGAVSAPPANPVQERLKRLLQLAAARGMQRPALIEVLAEMGLQEIELRPGWIEQLTDQQAKDLGAYLELGMDPDELPAA
jgi:hypothetical protein